MACSNSGATRVSADPTGSAVRSRPVAAAITSASRRTVMRASTSAALPSPALPLASTFVTLGCSSSRKYARVIASREVEKRARVRGADEPFGGTTAGRAKRVCSAWEQIQADPAACRKTHGPEQGYGFDVAPHPEDFHSALRLPMLPLLAPKKEGRLAPREI
jgi:hypothetical protein